MRWLIGLWHWRRCQIDLAILWPEFKKLEPDLDKAKAGFAAHALRNQAWLFLGREEVIRRIDGLS